MRLRKTEIFSKPRSIATTRVGSHGYLTQWDGLQLLASLKDGVADLVFLDPPFNLGKSYSHAEPEGLNERNYLRYMTRVLEESTRVVQRGGAVFMYHLPGVAIRLVDVLARELDFRHWIAIAMKNGFARGQHLYPAHYALLYFTKGEPAHFERPKTSPLRCRHCKELVRDYGGYRAIIEKKGVNLSDVWDDLSPVRHPSRKHRASNELPLELTDRVVAIAGFEAGLLVDPFAGTGTALVSAQHAKMRFVGNDVDPDSIRICIDRLRR